MHRPNLPMQLKGTPCERSAGRQALLKAAARSRCRACASRKTPGALDVPNPARSSPI
ncbi:hypothetical protein P4133_05045 [Pseudomonas aeruginosa]|nr:hypothetical protein [Pseudomonas aeruginosa]